MLLPVQRDECAFAHPTGAYATNSGLVENSRELRPVSVYSLRKRLEQWVGDVPPFEACASWHRS